MTQAWNDNQPIYRQLRDRVVSSRISLKSDDSHERLSRIS